ncbi:unnamed protein product [Auanema sp. JU1783]|nr:unnamed protein product [Auanema sp. JU1783]
MKPLPASRWSYSLFKDFYTIFTLMFSGATWSYALLAAVFIISAGNEFINYRSGNIIGKFYGALLDHDEKAFWKTFYKASILYIGQTLMIATFTFLSWILSYFLRKNLVKKLHEMYFSRKAYFHLCHDNIKFIDNPDQRISQDAEKLTTIFGQSIVPYVIVAPAVIAFYTYKTWKTAGGISVACIYGYFVIGFIANRIMAIPITRWTRRQEKAEGNFRFKHMSVRDNAEESAFYDAGEFEKTESNKILDVLILTLERYAWWKYPAQWFQLFFDYYGGVLTYLIQFIPVFIMNSYSDYTPGKLTTQISNNAFVFIYLINSFTRLTDLAMNIGEMAAYTIRIGEFVSFCRAVTDEDNTVAKLNEKEPILYKLDNVNIYAQGAPKTEVSNLTVQFEARKNILLTGSSGSGKTSLLRILKGLWKPQSGTIHSAISSKEVMFLPQNCYLPTGGLSLMDQLLFPLHTKTMENIPDINTITEILVSLQLEKLISLCGNITDEVDFEWKDVLSPGEQQRLSLARALIHRPAVVIMDEGTSSVSEDMEKRMYSMLKKNGINYISTGHRGTLLEYHDLELSLDNRSVWKLSEIRKGKYSEQF